jgi:glycosyltransferase involved in cell wall biosynthesis
LKLSIIVPCYNEEETIGEVLRQLVALQYPCEVEVIVVDDGSTDGSAKVVEKFSDVHLLGHEVNKGKGAAIRTGIEKCSGDIILIQDADLEYFPVDIPRLLQPVLTDQADVVLGSRILAAPKGMSRSHLIANRLLSYATGVLFGSTTSDLMTGYKVFARKAIQQVTIESAGFGVEAELVGKFLSRGLRVVEVPIRYEYRRRGSAKTRPTDGLRSLWALFKTKVHST